MLYIKHIKTLQQVNFISMKKEGKIPKHTYNHYYKDNSIFLFSSMPLERGNLSKHNIKEGKEIGSRTFRIICGIIFLCGAIWLSLRINYKLGKIRENFFPIIGKTILRCFILCLIVALIILMINAIGKWDEKKTSKK